MPWRSTRSPRCLESPGSAGAALGVFFLVLLCLGGLCGPLVVGAGVGEPPLSPAPPVAARPDPTGRSAVASTTAPAKRVARTRTGYDKRTPSLSRAYGVSCRARAERVALRRSSGDSPRGAGWPHRVPRSRMPWRPGFGWVYELCRRGRLSNLADGCRNLGLHRRALANP